MTVLVDTSALFALLDREDIHHEEAQTFLADQRDEELVTHNYVILESTALVGRRLGRPAVRSLLELIVPVLRVVWIDEETHQSAVTALLSEPSSPVSLVDRVSFEVMRRQAIDRAFAFDRDFAAEGVETVP